MVEPGPPRASLIAGPDHEGTRLDAAIARAPDPPDSRSGARRAIESGEALVNGQRAKPSYRLRPGDEVRWRYEPPRAPEHLLPEAIPLSILYEDEDVAVIDKPAGMVVHPAPGHASGTLVHALLYHFARLAPGSDPRRPGIVHRLDRDTSGALVVAKTERAHAHLAAQFHDHAIERLYHAVVVDAGLRDRGTFATGHVRDPKNRLRFTGRTEAGRRAVTHFETIERFGNQTALIACRLETGRTHQIRVHFAEAGCPLLGDALYGGRAASKVRGIERQALHARTLGFELPSGERVRTKADYPADFASLLAEMRRGARWRR